MRLRRAFTLGVFLFVGVFVPAQQNQDNQPATTYYHGLMGHFLEVQMTLTRRGNEITGSYEYASQRKPISLRGRISPSQDYDIDELDANGQPSARFKVNGLIRGLNGTWQSGKKKLPVSLGVISAAQLEQLHNMWSGSHKIKNLIAGPAFACALTESGAFCWGMVTASPSLATAGDGTIAEKALPDLAIPTDITSLALGQTVSCYLKQAAMYCWQPNSPYFALQAPTLIPGFEKDVTEIGISGWSACAIVAGALKCWRGTSLDPKNFEVIASGVTHLASGMPNCAQADGKVICWTTGSDPTKKEDLRLREIAGINDKPQALASFDGLGMGTRFACAVDGGTLKCWGDDIGNVLLGRRDEKQNFRDLPPAVLPSMETGVTAVSVQNLNACAIRDGKVFCWGGNFYGQVGNGTTGFTTGITEAALPAPAVQVAIGGTYSCAATSDGHIWCWGDNEFGQTGNASHDTCDQPNGKMPDPIVTPCNKRPVLVRGIP